MEAQFASLVIHYAQLTIKFRTVRGFHLYSEHAEEVWLHAVLLTSNKKQNLTGLLIHQKPVVPFPFHLIFCEILLFRLTEILRNIFISSLCFWGIIVFWTPRKIKRIFCIVNLMHYTSNQDYGWSDVWLLCSFSIRDFPIFVQI